MPAFAIYTRASEVGSDGSLSSDPADQEAAARAWAATRADVEIVDVVDEVVSGGAAAEDRRLGELIRRCESSELAGVIVRDERRFARDVIRGGRALREIVDAGARLIATATGFDSANLNSQTMLVFNMMMAVGQAERERNLEARMNAKTSFVEAGGYGAPAPFGYTREDGKLVANADADTVRDIFRRRAGGEGFSEIARHVPLTRSGVRRVVMNRAYVGEQRLAVLGRKGNPRVISDSHPPIVSEGEWQAANAVRGRAPIRRGLSEGADLKGLVKCGTCGRPMSILSYGKTRDKITYACTRVGCGAASLAVAKVERAVAGEVYDAIMQSEPHVAATLANDDRYERALADVEQAQQALAEYRDDVEIQRTLGLRDFAAGLATRREGLETARRALRETPRPEPVADTGVLPIRRVVAEVQVFPKSAPERATLRWHGSEHAISLTV